MSPIRRQVSRARRVLWLNLWFECFFRSLAVAAFVLGAVVLVSRLAGWSWPIGPIALGLLGAALVVSAVWSAVRRPDQATAAAALDEAAGLRERVSSSMYCEGAQDPFAQAVCADAEARAGSLTVWKHLRLRWPASWRWAGGALVLAVLTFLVPPGALRGEDKKAEQVSQVELTRTRVEVKKRMRDLKQMAETNPALADLKTELDKLDLKNVDKMDRPNDIRHEAVKKIDNFADAVRKKQAGDEFNKVNETKRMLRALQEPKGPKTPVQKLSQQLAAGDFKSAQETIKQIQEQLATLKQESDKEMVEALQKQLDQLSKQLEKVSNQEQLKKQLEQAGVKKEDVERMLQNLSKQDMDQLKKQLQQKGLPQKKIDQLTQQMQKQQQACQACRNMAQAVSAAAQSAAAGQGQQAADGMQSAADQLSELEQLEEQQKELESTAQNLQDMKNEMAGQGDGSGAGQGEGDKQNGMGQKGQGRGGLAQSNSTDVGFKVERGKVETTKGAIIGQFLVDGQQVKGDLDPEFVEVVTAAERDATDTVSRDRIPRQYQKAVKDYFSRLPGDLGIPTRAAGASGADDEAASETATESDSAGASEEEGGE